MGTDCKSALSGVVVSAKPKNQSNSNNSSSWYSWLFNRNGYVLWGPNRHGDLGGHKNGTRANSMNTNEIFGIGGKARSVRGSTMSWGWLERIFSALKGALDMQDRASTIKAISENSNTSTMEVQNAEPVVPDTTVIRQSLEYIIEHFPVTDLNSSGAVHIGPGNVSYKIKKSSIDSLDSAIQKRNTKTIQRANVLLDSILNSKR